jgi:hypothetical protein
MNDKYRYFTAKIMVVDPDSMTLCIRIQNPDHGSKSRGKKEAKKF